MRVFFYYCFTLYFFSVHALAQTGMPAKDATDVTSAEIQAAVKRGAPQLLAGARLTDELIALKDTGRYAVAVGVVTRPAGPDGRFLSHEKITEIYYIVRGSGVQLTGTIVNGKSAATVSPAIGPTVSSTDPLANVRRSKLGQGDVQIIPPNVGHGWESIDPGGVEYLVFRVDPDHALRMK